MISAILEVTQEARLVNGVNRAYSHGHRRKLPEIRHQPGMRVRRQTRLVAQLMTEILQVIFGQPPFEKRAGIEARRRVTLEVDQIAGLIADSWRGRSD